MNDQTKTKAQLINELVALRQDIVKLEGSETDHKVAMVSQVDGIPLFESIVESAPGSMVVSGADGEIVLVNRRAEELFGYRRDELLGKSIETLMPKRFRKTYVDHQTRFLSHPELRPMNKNFELTGQRKDGSEFPMDVYLSPIKLRDEILILSVAFDIT